MQDQHITLRSIVSALLVLGILAALGYGAHYLQSNQTGTADTVGPTPIIQPIDTFWYKLDATDGHFTVEFPGKPERKLQQYAGAVDKSDLGGVSYATRPTETSLLIAQYVTYPPEYDVNDHAALFIDTFAVDLNEEEGDVLHHLKPFTYDGYPAVDAFLTDKYSEDTGIVIVTRGILVDRTMYMLTAFYDLADEQPQDYQQFRDSFRLYPDIATNPAELIDPPKDPNVI